MEVSIYSRKAIGELIEKGFPQNTAVISFYTPKNKRDYEENRVNYSGVCDRVFYVGIKGKKFEFPKPYDFKLTAKDGISDLEGSTSEHYGSSPQNDFQKSMRCGLRKPLNQDYTNHSEQTISIISQVPDGGNIRDSLL